MSKQLIYHILIDRFFPSGNEDANGNFKGGGIKDIIDHLDYIQSLGMTGIMLTPFYHTAAYHGYHIIDFEAIDPHFGNKADLIALIDEIHRRDMIIVADFVANHCHVSSELFASGRHPDWFLFKRNGSYKSFANIGDLPMFNTDNHEVRQYLTDRALDLCRMGFDSIRLDHATGPTYKFWKYFVSKIKAAYPKIALIGEVWGTMDFKPRRFLKYKLNKWRYGAQEARQLEYVGILDGVLDFQYHGLVTDAIHKQESLIKNGKLYEEVKKHFNHYPPDFQLWLFLDNHDLNRILFECGFNKELVKSAVEFTEQWTEPFLMFYGTEANLTNKKSIFDGTPYADEDVRMPLIETLIEK